MKEEERTGQQLFAHSKCVPLSCQKCPDNGWFRGAVDVSGANSGWVDGLGWCTLTYGERVAQVLQL